MRLAWKFREKKEKKWMTRTDQSEEQNRIFWSQISLNTYVEKYISFLTYVSKKQRYTFTKCNLSSMNAHTYIYVILFITIDQLCVTHSCYLFCEFFNSEEFIKPVDFLIKIRRKVNRIISLMPSYSYPRK